MDRLVEVGMEQVLHARAADRQVGRSTGELQPSLGVGAARRREVLAGRSWGRVVAHIFLLGWCGWLGDGVGFAVAQDEQGEQQLQDCCQRDAAWAAVAQQQDSLGRGHSLLSSLEIGLNGSAVALSGHKLTDTSFRPVSGSL
jgi:hypothetical protein